MSASIMLHLHSSIRPRVSYSESEDAGRPHDWILVGDEDHFADIALHGAAAESVVTAIVGALPEPRRVALLKTLTQAWYAASAKAEGLGYIGSAGGQLEPADAAPEDERFEEPLDESSDAVTGAGDQ